MNFVEKDIPYDQFARLGLNKRDILFMKKDDLQQLLSGKRTSLIEISSIDGKKLDEKIKAKFSLQLDENGNVNLMIHPVRKEINNDIDLNKTQIEKLQKGQLITKKIDGENYLVQLDKDNNELIRTKVKDINIPSHIEHIELGNEQKDKLRKGEPVVLQDKGREFQISLDLNARLGFKYEQLQNQELENKMAFDREHPEVVGFVQTDENRDQYLTYQKEHEPAKKQEEQSVTNKIKL